MQTRWGLLALAGLLVVGCGARPGAELAAPPPVTPGVVLQGTAASEDAAPVPATPLPEAEPVEPTVLTLKVWTAEGLAPKTDSPGGETLLSQLTTFNETHPDIQVEVQVKGVSGRGSALDYLRTAPPVAPSVLPDLVLLNRNALVMAAREGLIVPLTDATLLAMEEDLYPAASRLGSVNGMLMSMPYLLEIRHSVYREPLFKENPPVSYADVLPDRAGEAPAYIFPAARTGGVNRTTLLQYLAAGGSLTDNAGNPFVDAEALTEVLTFYEEARDNGVLDPSVLQYSTTADTWELYRLGEVGLAEVSSAPYLAGRAEVADTGLASIPTAQGNPITLVTGWSWALVTGDPERQAAASALVAWLLEPVNHGTYAQAVGYLPTQPGALAVWGDDDPYVPFANHLLEAAELPPDPAIDSTVGVAMQNAVQDVLLGRASAQEASTAAAAAVNAQAE